MGKGTYRGFAVAALVAACLSATPAAPAEAPSILPAILKDRLFFFGGLDAARDSQFSWAGFVGAPFGSINEDGLRLRFMGGVGRYRYRTDAVAGGVNQGIISSGEFMLGWRHASKAAIFAAYLGAHVENQQLRANDPGNPAAGTAAGMKAAIELFARPWPEYTATAIAAASTVHRSYHARVTLARELNSYLALGVEGVILGDARYFEPRAGLLAAFSFSGRTVTLSGGYLLNSDKGAGAYLTLSLYAPL